MKSVLRLQLPRLEALAAHTPLPFALLDGGKLVRSGELPLAGLAATLPVMPVVAILHPADATLAQAALPPLPAHRMQAALAGAVEPLVLGDVDELVLAHGPRGSDGASPVAWAQRGGIAQAWSLLADAGLPVDALVPAPLALPLPADGSITLMLHDGFLLCRTGRDTGQALALDPLGAQDATDPSVQAFLRVMWMRHPEAQATWVDAVPTGWNAIFESRDLPPTTVLPDAARWSAPVPTWSLAVPALRPARLQRSPWRRPLAWVAAAVAVWTVGLNVHALRLEQEASALRQRMASEVRAAFPALPVVLDPLRQATQQRDALLAGTGSVTDTDFLPLALAASQLLPMSANNVASLAYADDTLSLRLIDNAAAGGGALDPAIATRARGLGLQVDQRDGAWILRRQDDGSTSADAGGVRVQPSAATAQRLSERARSAP